MRKLGVIFVSIRKYGSSESHGLMGHVETAGPLLFRLILWVALVSAVLCLFKPQKSDSGRPSLHSAASSWPSSPPAFCPT